ncbi:DUF4230 domain-containing protein [Phaeodactylibacter luteus]|uniref:DUF4230 domain-containing protein n=1 Tax=Phaeodactylibacter luteus TaxID=1564516 RepID=A0A5C6S587_9BACT|nr:DUF4230 domain-containing protein [Phaeodactylibacter luteus]TXB69427.1 DUF4230 domain-containing protein [Phaeodactylibacter luteus]
MARNTSDTGASRQSLLRALAATLGLGLIGLFIYKKVISPAGYTDVPQEYQVTYVPSDFQLQIDEEQALDILSNPTRNRRAFDRLVYDLNLNILRHVGRRMNLDDSALGRVQEEYEKHHPYLAELYFNDFTRLNDTTGQLYETWYDNEGSGAVQALREVAGKYTCFLVTQVITSLVPTQGGSIYAKGKEVNTPCGVAMQEAVAPMLAKLSDRAAIRDFGRSRGLLQEKVERVIAELATMEVRDKKGLNRNLQTKVFGFAVSSSDIEVSAISLLKVGFRLNDYFDIQLNSRQEVVTITLPQPVILSHEVYPKIDKLDIGWMREVENIDLNKNFNVLRSEFRREALESDIFEKAENQAIELMNTLFGPIVKGISPKYQLRVVFADTGAPLYEDLSEEANQYPD